jgi:hypothetical protein
MIARLAFLPMFKLRLIEALVSVTHQRLYFRKKSRSDYDGKPGREWIGMDVPHLAFPSPKTACEALVTTG